MSRVIAFGQEEDMKKAENGVEIVVVKLRCNYTHAKRLSNFKK